MVCAMACMVWLLRSVTSQAWRASVAAWPALLALWRTVPVICSIEAAVCSRLAACDSVRADRSWLPLAISCMLWCMFSVSTRASRTTDARLTLSWLSARDSRPIRSWRPVSRPWVRSAAAMRLAAPSMACIGCVTMWRSKAPPAAPSANSSVAPTTAVSPGPIARPCRAKAPPKPARAPPPAIRLSRPGRSRRSASRRRPVQVERSTRPPRSRCTRWPLSASRRMVAYRAVAAATVWRSGDVRTDM